MPERVAIPQPPIDFGATSDPNLTREWMRKIAQAVRETMTQRPTGVMVSNAVDLGADQDDYEHGQVDVLRLDATTGVISITGFDAQGFRDFYLVNAGSNAITLDHESTSSSTTNRITSKTGANVAIASDASARLWYDGDSSRWRILSE